MNKVITIDQAEQLGKKLTLAGKTIVLAGGCFDILHVGHLTFLEKAKMYGDILCVMLESDESIKLSKGSKRPINTLSDRAKMLSALTIVDYVIQLKPEMSDEDYDQLVIAVKPAIIATTAGDKNRAHKERQASLIHADVIDVVQLVDNQSTSRIFEILQEI